MSVYIGALERVTPIFDSQLTPDRFAWRNYESHAILLASALNEMAGTAVHMCDLGGHGRVANITFVACSELHITLNSMGVIYFIKSNIYISLLPKSLPHECRFSHGLCAIELVYERRGPASYTEVNA